MREIVLDTETTGLDPTAGHRIVEIGCVELINHMPTGKIRQWYINPERDMPDDAYNVHGLSEDFLADKPVFASIVDDFLAFLEGAVLVAHNASFDIRFLNSELAALDRPNLAQDNLIDTIALARKNVPGAQYSLDALCRRFNIDTSARQKHGALLDAELLAEVYLELIGGRQPNLVLANYRTAISDTGSNEREALPPRPHTPTAEESAAHRAFIANMDNPVWKK